MTISTRGIQRIAQDFRRTESGAVAIIFALAALVIVMFIGVAVDYARAQYVFSQLRTSADTAALAAARQGAQDYAAGASGWQTTGAAAGDHYFDNNATQLSVGVMPVRTITLNEAGGTITAAIDFSASVPTTFMNVMHMASIPVGGTVTASIGALPYTDIHIVIDNSTSMGIGATASDQSTIYAATGCTLACHIADGGGDKDTLAKAHAAGATLRIDVAKAAVAAEIDKLKDRQGGLGQIRVAIYTLSNSLTNVFALSSDLTGAINAAKAVDLVNEQYQAGTNTTYSLGQLKDLLSVTGNGATSSSPRGVVMLLTDGVQNSIQVINPTGTVQSYVRDPNFVDISPQYVDNSLMTVQAFDPSVCGPVKGLGYTFMTMNVQYLIPSIAPDSNDGRFTWIQTNLSANIASNMQSCATSADMSMSASNPKDITDAVTLMFGKVFASVPHLTH